jgi:hypothetical protein
MEDFFNDYIYQPACGLCNKLPEMKTGAFYSFVLSAAITGVVTANPSTALISGAVSATASVISSLVSPILAKNGLIPSGDKGEIGKRTACILIADYLFTGGKTTMRQALVSTVMSAVIVFQNPLSAYNDTNQRFVNLKV